MNQRPMTIFDLLGVLYSRRRLLFGILFAIVGAGMIVTFLMPPTYQSTMKILVARNRIDPQVTPTEKNSDFSGGELTEEEFNSELEILQSRAVIEGAVKQLGLDKQDENASRGWLARLRAPLANLYRSFHRQTAPDATERAATYLAERLEAVSIKKSRIIKVTYQDSNPERAAQVLDELYRQYAEHQMRLRQNSKAANVFREQSEAFSRKLDETTEALKRFDTSNGIAANTSQRDLLQQQSYQTQSDLDKARTEIRETEQRIAALSAQLAAQPERIESESRTKYVLARDKMKDEILTLELQRTQLLQKYQPNHRLVKDVEQRLAQARELLAREEQSPPQERTTVLNDVHRRLTNELLTAQANLTTLRERVQILARLASQYQAQVARFDTKSLDRTDLERARAINEEAYLLYRKKAQEADIVNALNQERVVNFSLAEAPSVNHKPVSPKPLINLAVLIVVGLMAAVAIVAFLERNRLISSEAQLLAAIRAGSLPLADGNHALSLPGAMLLLANNQSLRNGRQRLLSAGGGDAQSSPGQLEPLTNIEEPAGGAPEAWRVEAIVDYLRRVYRLSPEELSEVLHKTAGWKFAPGEIDKILLSTASRKSRFDGRQRVTAAFPDLPQAAVNPDHLTSGRRRVTAAFPDSQPDEVSPRPERD
ncbi:MAG: GumC family protein [Blastocatellia bacterium]